MDYDQLGRVIRYMTSRKEDFYHAVSDPNELTAHKMLADFLEENGDSHLSGRIKEQIRRQEEGQPIKPNRLGDQYSDHDFVLHAVRTGHPSPTVRAFASMSEVGMPPHPDLLNLLMHSDPAVRPTDHDVAVFLSPEDGAKTHSEHSRIKRINRQQLDTGIQAKVVRGTAYLLDHEHPDRRSYGAPAIVFTAPVNDRDQMKELEDHATQLHSERTGLEGVAHMGPVH